MVTEFTEALGRVASYAFACNDPIRSGIPSQKEGYIRRAERGITLVRDGTALRIVGRPSDDFLRIESGYYLSRQIRFSEQDVESIDSVLAAFEDDGVLEKTRSAVDEEWSGDPKLSLEGSWREINGQELFNGFTIYQKYFAYDDMGIDDYDEALNRVIRNRITVAQAAHSEIDFFNEDIEEDVGDGNVSASPGFQ